MAFLDTNIILRHILNDDPDRSTACFNLMQAIERGDVSVWTSDLVIAELVFVLSSKRTYNLSRQAIRDTVLPILGLSHIHLPYKRLYDRVFELYTSLPIDFVDAYHAALMENRQEQELYSYDAHFDEIQGIKRPEP